MSVLNHSGEEQEECPLCMEPLEVDDRNFFPCTCGYQICRFCWHRIRTDENGLCPACRKGYPENPANFKPLSQEEMAKLKAEKRHKDQQRKLKITENRKHLANVRVVQRNLVFVVGLPMRLADSEVLKKHEYFGKFGKIHKVVINQCTSYAGTQGPSASAYVTYQRSDDALRAIQAVNNISVDGRSIKSSLGTTKYCSHFMKNQACPKPDCMYLHDQAGGRCFPGDAEASFTKEEMQQGKHQEYEKKLHDALIAASSKPSPPATTPAAVPPSAPGKEAWPSLQAGTAPTPPVPNNNGVVNGNGGKGDSARNNKNRHSSGEEDRTEECPDLEDARSSQDSQEEEEEEEESSDEGSDPIPQATSARLAAAIGGRQLFEPDNNSFFSTNSFTKVAAASHGTGGLDWQMNGLSQNMPDMMLPTAHPTEDWQAAFSNLASEKQQHDGTAVVTESNPGHIFTSLHSQYNSVPPCDYRQQQQHQHYNTTSKFFSDYHLGHPTYPTLDGRLHNGDVSEASDVARYQSEANEDEKYFRRSSSGEFGYGEAGKGDDDWGFDVHQEMQKALAEMMEKETTTTAVSTSTVHQQQHQQPPGHYTYPPLYPQQQYGYSHMRSGPVTGCSRLLDGLGLGPSTQRTRLPPPGFSTAPNHMNAFGLGIPRAPTNNGSKILPFMGINSNNNGSLSPVPQQQQSMLFPPPSPHRPFSLANGMKDTTSTSMQYKDWSENLRGLIPFAPTTSPPPQYNAPPTSSKGWTGPCTDWTALDPAIVSSSRPQQHWLRHLDNNTTAFFNTPAAPPPPGFAIRQQSAGVGDL